MRSKSWILCALANASLGASLIASLGASVAHADELKMATEPGSSANQPARGMSMEKVEASYGAPANRAPAIGDPPITRWEYPGFVVYFEHNLVLHTVAKL